MNVAPFAVLGFQALGGYYSAYQGLKSGMLAQRDAEIVANQKERDARELSTQIGLKRDQVNENYQQYSSALTASVAGAGFAVGSSSAGDIQRMSEIKKNKQLAMIGYGGALQARAFHEEAASIRRRGTAARAQGKAEAWSAFFDTGSSMANFGLNWWGAQKP